MARSVAVLGAGGIMGFAMARNLAQAGLEVRAWNRSRERAEPLAGDVARIADSPAEAAEGSDIVLTMLSDADAVLEAVADTLAPARLWLQTSTVGILGTERCAALAEETGAVLIDAPVLGTKAPAEQGELIVLASGPDDARGDCEPVFDAVGKKTMWLGQAGAGTRLKMVVNAWIVSVVEGLAETIALAEGTGVDPGRFLEAIGGGPLDSGYAQAKGKAMIERSFEPSFRLALAAKDAGLVTEAAERHDLDLPVLRAIAERLAEGVARHGDDDMAATVATSAPDGR